MRTDRRSAALRGTPTAQGRTVGPHGVYVASSPLEHLGSAFLRGQGQLGINQGEAGQGALIERLDGEIAALTAQIQDPAFYRQPADAVTTPGATVTFAVAASGKTPFTLACSSSSMA